jgi:hypothetical protein
VTIVGAVALRKYAGDESRDDERTADDHAAARK